MTRQFTVTTYTIKVLSDDGPASGLSLQDLDAAIETGPCVGDVQDDGGVPLTGKQMADMLLQFRSQPSFFGLDDDGNALGNDVMDDKTSRIYRLDAVSQATVLAALEVWRRLRKGKFDEIRRRDFSDLATDAGLFKALDARQVEALSCQLGGAGLGLCELLPYFAERAPDSPYVKAAQAHPLVLGGNVTLCEPIVASVGTGEAHVLAWLSVPHDEAASVLHQGAGQATSPNTGANA